MMKEGLAEGARMVCRDCKIRRAWFLNEVFCAGVRHGQATFSVTPGIRC